MAGTYAPIKDAAEHFKVSVSTFRNWVKTGVVPDTAYIKVGETYRFNIDLVETALLGADKPEHNENIV